jgi:hypothetical protein
MARHALALALAALLATPAAALTSDELLGTWHVIAHFQDAAAPNKDAKRWEDRVWTFERKGDRLQWTEHPIVVFEDETGRFEDTGTNRAARVLDYWEPNAAQLAEIQAGPRVNSRGSKVKQLRGADAKGWSSASGGPGYASASIVTFEETWNLTGLPDRPRFERVEVMGAAATESLEGRTMYETTSVEQDGDLLRGTFNRDGTRVGTFQMRRGGAPRGLESKYASDGERALVALFGESGRELFRSQQGGAQAIDEAELRRQIGAGQFGADDREALQERFALEVSGQIERQGGDARRMRPQIEKIAEKMVRAFVDDGKSLAEIREQVASGKLAP